MGREDQFVDLELPLATANYYSIGEGPILEVSREIGFKHGRGRISATWTYFLSEVRRGSNEFSSIMGDSFMDSSLYVFSTNLKMINPIPNIEFNIT